jgi:hypothetical protein
MTVQGAISSHTFRTWLGCEVFTHTEGNMTHVELSVPIALELAPDSKKDAGKNWETGNFSGGETQRLRKLTARKIIPCLSG